MFGVPPNTLPLLYTLGIFCYWVLLHYNMSFKTIAGGFNGAFWWYGPLSEDRVLNLGPKIEQIYQNYLVALIVFSNRAGAAVHEISKMHMQLYIDRVHYKCFRSLFVWISLVNEKNTKYTLNVFYIMYFTGIFTDAIIFVVFYDIIMYNVIVYHDLCVKCEQNKFPVDNNSIKLKLKLKNVLTVKVSWFGYSLSR